MVIIFYLIGQCSTDRKVRGESMSDRQQMGYMVPGPPALPGELQVCVRSLCFTCFSFSCLLQIQESMFGHLPLRLKCNFTIWHPLL